MCGCPWRRLPVGFGILTRNEGPAAHAPRKGIYHINTLVHQTNRPLQNITALASTPTRLFALSSTGHVYALSSRASAQVPSGSQPPASSSWFGIFGGEENTIDFVQLSAPLVRGEKITQIAAGTHHLLARTSNGRALALALGPRANSHGQLGLRRISTSTPGEERELLPDSVIRDRNPEMRAAPPITIRSPSQPKPTSVAVEDDIRFAGAAFQEIPALHGIQVAQLAAGARNSLARTEDGRVLAWGANEFG
jgi:alpha-tubulin suppressor-like RCC1 family protein